MKYKIIFFQLIIILLAFLNVKNAIGDTLFNYRITNELKKEVVITSLYSTDDGIIIIPSKQQLYPNTAYSGIYTVIGIDSKAFRDKEEILSVYIPSSIKTIGYWAFEGCKNLNEVTIEEGLEKIEPYAFRHCKNITTFSIPNSTVSIGQYAFSGCEKLSSVNIGSSVNTIGEYAFWNCSALKSIILPNSLKTIEAYSFQHCISINSIQIPNSVEKIDEYAFSNCRSLVSVTIPNSVTNIAKNVFSSCSSLSIISLPNNLKRIEQGTFAGCVNLREVNLPMSIEYIGDGAFSGTGIVKMVIPSNVSTIDEYAFSKCKQLEEVHSRIKRPTSLNYNHFRESNEFVLYVPYGTSMLYKERWKISMIKKIQEELWVGDTIVSNIRDENNPIDVDFRVLNVAPTELQLGINKPLILDEKEDNLNIPNYITLLDGGEAFVVGIGDSTFYQTKLRSIRIPRSVKYINANAYNECSNLMSVYVDWREPKKVYVHSDNFLNNPPNSTLHVPAGTKERYAEHEVWGRFSHIIESSPISIGDIIVRNGNEVDLPVYLRNNEDIAGLQMKLTMPEGISISGEGGYLNSSLTERTEGMTVLGGKDPDEDNSYLFVLLSLDGHSILGQEGAIMNIPLNVAPEMATGYYEMKLEDVQMATSTFATLTPADATSDLTVRNYDIGDINDDGYIDVADLTASVKFILGNAGNNLLFMAADVDESGIVEINDYSAVVNMVLAQDREVQHVRARHLPAENDHSVCALTPTTTFIKQNGEGEVMVALINDGNKYTGMQFDLSLPEGLIIADDGISASSKKHDVIFTKKQNGGYRVLCTSDNNAELYGDSIALRIRLKDVGAMTGTYEITMNNVVLSDMDAIRHTSKSQVSSVLVGDVTTGLSESTNQLEVIADQGQLTLKSHRQQTVTIVSLSGIVINQFEMNDGETITLKLGSGIYFVNEKMIINK